jgi:ribosomal protein L22
VAKGDQKPPGAEGADDEAKLEQEAAESKQAEAEEKPKRARRKPAAKKDDEAKAEEKPKRTRRKPAAKKDDDAKEEEKPKRTRRKPAAKKDEDAEEVKEEDAAKEVEAEEAEVEGEPEPEDEQARPKSGGRRRGGAAAAGRSRRATPARRGPDGGVTVRARAKYVRCAPRKARLVIDHIRGKGIEEARAILAHTPRAASRDVLKLLDSAIANAENNHELVADELRIGKAYVDEGPTLKRYRPRALGRATRIRKRTSHLTIELVAKE